MSEFAEALKSRGTYESKYGKPKTEIISEKKVKDKNEEVLDYIKRASDIRKSTDITEKRKAEIIKRLMAKARESESKVQSYEDKLPKKD